MVKIKKFTFNAFQVNTYLVYDDTGECAIIDASCYDKNEKKLLSDFIKDNQLTCFTKCT